MLSVEDGNCVFQPSAIMAYDPAWESVEILTRNLSLLLLRLRVPQEAAPIPPDVERAIDQWIRDYSNGPAEFVFPVDPLMRRGLFARLRYATSFASQHKLYGLPLPKLSGGSILEILLIETWHLQFRALWLSGERGTDVTEN